MKTTDGARIKHPINLSILQYGGCTQEGIKEHQCVIKIAALKAMMRFKLEKLRLVCPPHPPPFMLQL